MPGSISVTCILGGIPHYRITPLVSSLTDPHVGPLHHHLPLCYGQSNYPDCYNVHLFNLAYVGHISNTFPFGPATISVADAGPLKWRARLILSGKGGSSLARGGGELPSFFGPHLKKPTSWAIGGSRYPEPHPHSLLL